MALTLGLGLRIGGRRGSGGAAGPQITGWTIDTAPDPDAVDFTCDMAATIDWLVNQTPTMTAAAIVAAVAASGGDARGSYVWDGVADSDFTIDLSAVPAGDYYLHGVGRSGSLVGNAVVTAFTSAAASITVVGSFTGTGNSPGSITMSGLTENDYVIAVAMMASNTVRTGTMNSAGWTLLGNTSANSTCDSALYAWGKRMSSSPDTAISISLSGASADGRILVAQAYRGVDTTTALDVAVVTASNVNSRAANPGAVTPVTAGAIVVSIGGAAYLNPSVDMTEPALSDVLAHKGSGSTYSASMLIGHQDWTSGALNPAAMTISGSVSGDSWAAMTIALRPA
jgi:hypothetical protein